MPTTMTALRFLTAVIGPEAYGVPVDRIRDLRRVPPFQPLDGFDAAVRGTYELRGSPVLGLDLRTRLGATAAPAPHPCLLVIEARPDGTPPLLLGLIVDTVEEVFCSGEGEPADCAVCSDGPVVGECRIRGLRKHLLDVDRLIRADEAAAFHRRTAAG